MPRLLLALALPLLLAAGPTGPTLGVRALGPPVKGEARRVVSLAPSLTETVLALGAGDRLVGVTRYCDFPEVAALPKVGGYLDPNLEAILSARPELVLAEESPGNEEVVRTLAAAGVSVLVVRAKTLPEIGQTLRAVGEALKRADEGEALARALDASLQALQREAAGLPKVRALILYNHDPLVVAGPGSFGDALLTLVGGENIAHDAGAPYPVFPVERVIARDPDVIIDLSFQEAGAPAQAPPALDGLRATRSGRLLRLDAPGLNRPGPSVPAGARALFCALHPSASACAPPPPKAAPEPQ